MTFFAIAKEYQSTYGQGIFLTQASGLQNSISSDILNAFLTLYYQNVETGSLYLKTQIFSKTAVNTHNSCTLEVVNF